ncbi:hypothetical protein SH668x_002509 [Planctomicrobium sp. SH668]|uniref:hypothetical protein n=1 Tax=Planctomicrobium sp. SH668 TaxID=3448126 RepID=UPI003F5BED70
MDAQLEFLNGMRVCAQLVVKVFAEEFGVHLEQNAFAVDQISKYIEILREMSPLSQEAEENTVTTLGAFVGECILHQLGGEWRHTNGWWGISLREGITAYPFVQVRSQLHQGAEQSVLRYFLCLESLCNHFSGPDVLEGRRHPGVLNQLIENELLLWNAAHQSADGTVNAVFDEIRQRALVREAV